MLEFYTDLGYSMDTSWCGWVLATFFRDSAVRLTFFITFSQGERIGNASLWIICPQIGERVGSGNEIDHLMVRRIVHGLLCRSFLWRHLCVAYLSGSWNAILRCICFHHGISFVFVRFCGYDIALFFSIRNLLASRIDACAAVRSHLSSVPQRNASCGDAFAVFQPCIQSGAIVVLVAQTLYWKESAVPWRLAVRHDRRIDRMGRFMVHCPVFGGCCNALERKRILRKCWIWSALTRIISRM